MTDRDQAATQMVQHLSFSIAGTDYAIPILKVKEILQYEEVTRVPGTPASIRGVLNVRGAVVPVVDLGVKFGNDAAMTTPRTCVLVVETHGGSEMLVLGVLADSVNEVVDLRASDVEPPPRFGAGVRLDYLTGVGKVGNGFVLLIDIDRVLTASEAEIAAQTALAADAAAAAADASSGAAPAEGAPPAA